MVDRLVGDGVEEKRGQVQFMSSMSHKLDLSPYLSFDRSNRGRRPIGRNEAKGGSGKKAGETSVIEPHPQTLGTPSLRRPY